MVLIVSSFDGCSKKATDPPKSSTYLLTTTFAGAALGGAADTLGFNGPSGVVADAAGNIYVVDSGNNLVWKIKPGGTENVLAGNGSAGALNGPALMASFNAPYAIAIDAEGNLYISDSGNNMIRKISTAGNVTTLAGSGSAGSANGTGASASFNNPCGIAVDGAGNVYVCDASNEMIRKISPAGQVANLAGGGLTGLANGTGITARFNNPVGLAFDAEGNLYVADSGNQVIREVSANGSVTTYAGTGATGSINGSLTTATFNAPNAIAFDVSGNMYITDGGNSVIRKVSTAGVVSTIAGDGTAGFTNGIGTGTQFDNPCGIAIDQNLNAYVADFGNDAIRKIILKQ